MRSPIVVLSAALLLLAGCTAFRSKRHIGESVIPVVDERLALSPLLSEAGLERLEGWPVEQTRQELLLREFTVLGNQLRTEFRRCEKLGFYRMVDDADNPSVRIALTLLPFELARDTLSMPVRLQVERLPDGQRFIYTIPAKAFAPPGLKEKKPFHYVAQLLADYRRDFPYETVVSFFYPHEEEP